MGTQHNGQNNTQGHLYFQPTVIQPLVPSATLTDTEGNPAGVGANPIVTTNSGISGTYAYASGTVGATVVVPVGGKVIGLSVISPTGSAATYAINAGATVTIPAGSQIGSGVEGQLVAPTIVITNPASFLVEWCV